MMLKIRMYLLILAMGLVAFEVNAQEDSLTFSLLEAQQYAMENSYVLHNTSQDVEIAERKVWETITIGLPQVSGTANYNMFLNLPVSLLPAEIFGGEPGTYIPVKFGQDYNSDFGVNVSQMIFDGSYIVGVGSSQLYLNLSKQAHEKTEIDIRDAVAQAYYMVLIGQRYKMVMEENLLNSKNLYNETK
ncbi:MAG: TolC family protein, partial [Draconibacterium sp.]|nr:TolC family protein [Draconibacterium sp.]